MSEDTFTIVRRIVADALGIVPEQVAAEDTVGTLIARHGNADTPPPDPHLLSDLGADSLTVVEIVMGLEEEFDMDVPDTEADQMVQKDMTIREIAEFVERHRSQ